MEFVILNKFRMRPLISKSGKIGAKDELILIGSSKSKFKQDLFTPEEIKYLQRQISFKEKTIVINQYSRRIYIQLIEGREERYQEMEAARIAAARIHPRIRENKVEKIVVQHIDGDAGIVLAFTEGLALFNYQFIKYHSQAKEKEHSLKKIALAGNGIRTNQIDELNSLISAVYQARDLINEPVSALNAVKLSKEILRMGRESGFKVEILNKARIEALKFGGLLAVNKGSLDPPTFTIMTWKPANAKNKKPIVLVGKGVVYDTGGLSLKPTPDSMDHMKCDMSGAAAVAGALFALASNKIPVYVIALVPATDNRPGGNAYAPGDVVVMHDKTTVEVLNSDAEGRMILGDALAYAKHYKPLLGITVATLTGSASRAIGKNGTVGMGNASREVFNALIDSGNNVYERIAEFPFWEEYGEMIKSDIADIQNVGGADAGAITAGKFLEHFTDYPFIHLDIAGPAFLKASDHYRVKGGTGVGVRMLYDFLKKYKG
jgi:leucyl aminopeptidase